ncbi:hypothetical protein FGG08_007454 [Glutinoglossum americanum]|uniref:NACHT domain-containing protein n=1 Tax=Glutinoglossum americanum TaxID=1670608 RepID=A0A9P8I3A7_9PEZI|nr:hypothetical protein FGG08_007454 [Glutinoglossum americanum]
MAGITQEGSHFHSSNHAGGSIFQGNIVNYADGSVTVSRLILDPATRSELTCLATGSGPESREAEDCLRAIFLTDPTDNRSKLIAAKGKRVDGTCEWLTCHPVYESWLKDPAPQILWVSGGPGKGKTILSIFLTYELESVAKPPNGMLVYYFCDNKDEKRNTAIAILRGLLFQLLRQRPQLFKYILADFKIQKEALFAASSFDALWRIFTAILQDRDLNTVYCVLDGLDECEEKSLELLLKKFRDFFSQSGHTSSTSSFKLITTSRDLPRCIKTELYGFPRVRLDPDSDDDVNSDIRRYITYKVDELAEIGGYSEIEYKIVERALMEGAKGTFLWVGFVTEELKGKNRLEVEEVLRNAPPGLDGVYDRMLRQIEGGRREIAALILRWVVVAVRPLTLAELSVATDTRASGLYSREEVMENQVGYCGLLLKVNQGKVGLVHQSVKDYLEREEPHTDSVLEFYRVKRGESHLEVARTCYNYVQTGGFSDRSLTIRKRWFDDEPDIAHLRAYPLLEYATLYWPEHARYAPDAVEYIFDLSSSFCQDVSTCRENWLRTYWDSEKFYGRPPKSFTLMHLAACFGIFPLARKLLRLKRWRIRLALGNPVNKRDGDGRTPLSWAAENGHEAMVKLLLEKRAELEPSDSKYGQTPLLFAAENGHEAVVKLLLEKGAKMESTDNKYGQTPLSWAAENGREAVVKLLLEKGAEMESTDSEYGQTPLSWAAESGHEAVVKLLLEKGADMESTDSGNGRTPLSWAAGNGHEAVVKLLLEKGAEMESIGSWNAQTPLSWAAGNGHEAVVKLLLEKGAEMESTDSKNGRTPLSWAAGNGHKTVVNLLLEKGAEMESTDSKIGQTPLSWAARNGHEAVVKLLLEKGAEMESKDYIGHTPLFWATLHGRGPTVEL